jgi:hypothetical protein
LIKDNGKEDATVFGVSPEMFDLCSGIALLHDALEHLPGPMRDDALEAAVDVIEGATPKGEAGQWLVGKLRRGE